MLIKAPSYIMHGPKHLSTPLQPVLKSVAVSSRIMTGTDMHGMNCVREVGIVNYRCHYRVANVVGAGLIAAVASLVALRIFFRLTRNLDAQLGGNGTYVAPHFAGAASRMQ